MKLNLHFTPYSKINKTWVKDLHVRAKIVKLLFKKKVKIFVIWVK